MVLRSEPEERNCVEARSLGTFAVNEEPVQLEVEEIVEAASNVPAPMEEKTVESLRLEESCEKLISLALRDGVEDLV